MGHAKSTAQCVFASNYYIGWTSVNKRHAMIIIKLDPFAKVFKDSTVAGCRQ